MLRMILATAMALTFYSSVSSAGSEFRIGAGNVTSTYEPGNSPAYFDTYPGNFCGVKALRVAVLGQHNSFNRSELVNIGRVYFAFQTPAPNGPFAAYVKVNVAITPGQTTAWIPVPSYQGSCLKKVRVYAEGQLANPFDQHDNLRVVVIGTK